MKDQTQKQKKNKHMMFGYKVWSTIPTFFLLERSSSSILFIVNELELTVL